jgi:Zn-dependent peptidase ImmA (M78 family)/transcriptional regulator with XRE-family HTH domain
MNVKLPINPAILRWARESQNLLIEDVALKMNKPTYAIEAWEKGDSSPTYVQLETLAYTVFKRPVAVFFFPEPPEEVTPKNSFRTLPESEVEELAPTFLCVFRQAQTMQINLEELTDGQNPAPKKMIEDLTFDIHGDIRKMVESVREYLGVSLAEQVAWADTEEALDGWRSAVEDKGIFVFKEAFRDNEISGFCLYDDEFPIIYINNSMPKTRQIFTLFHELTHLLFKTGGVDKQNDAFLRRIKGDNRKIEVLCNRFAGEFLVPKDDFDKIISGVQINEQAVENLAKRYNVSREVILRKCLEKRLVDQAYYEEQSQRWIKEARERAAERVGGNYYSNKATYLGESYLNLAFTSYYQKRFSPDQLAEYLGVKVASIPGLEMAFMGRG